MRPVIGSASLVNFEAMMEGNIETARKFDDGKITAEQYIAEIRAQWEEFAAKNNEEGSQDSEPEHRQEQCNSIIQTVVTPWITAGQEAAALEKLRSLGCLK
jgi:hypothetical protein